VSLVARDLGVDLDRRRVLSGVSIEVHRGEVLGLIGPNGAGKSTLLRSLGGLVRPVTGEVAIDGSRLSSLRPRKRAARVAYVAQDTAAAADVTAAELVLMGRYAHRRRLSRTDTSDEEVVRDALEAVGIARLADRAVPSLSGGERQLVQIARALAQRAGMLLLDEPTSALDVRHQLRVFEILRARADAGVGVAVVLHDLNDASRYCDRLAVLHRGRLVAHGAPEHIITPERIAAVYRIAATVDADVFGYPHIHPTAPHRAPRSAAPTGGTP